MPQPDTEQPTAEQQAQAVGIRTYLHDQADQLGEEAEQLAQRASATYSEAEAIEAEAERMHERSEYLHRQADKAKAVGNTQAG